MELSVFPSPLVEGRLVRRYQRFLADVRFRDGRVETVHCPNPGRMTGCDRAGAAVLVSRSDNPKRKLPHTWELVRAGRTWVCINTGIANRVVAAWLGAGGLLPELGPVRPEVSVDGSRFDFVAVDGAVVEVKSVTLKTGPGEGAFPDAVTARGRRHVETLAGLAGRRRVLLYFVARADIARVRPAAEIDPAYADALRAAADAGVEVRAVAARFTKRGVRRAPDPAVIL